MVLVGGHLKDDCHSQGCHGTFLLCLVIMWGHQQPLITASSQAQQLAMSLTSSSTWFGIQDHVLSSQLLL